jgi:flagellar biosynthesis protein
LTWPSPQKNDSLALKHKPKESPLSKKLTRRKKVLGQSTFQVCCWAMEQSQDHTLSAAPVKPDGARAVAVAIEGNRSEDLGNPGKVIASGYGKLAREILDIAFANDIKVREDGALADILAALDLDTPIPSEAIVAVAEILAKVYEANESSKAAWRESKGTS